MGRKNVSKGKNKKITDFTELFNEINGKKKNEDNLVKDIERKEG